MSPSVDERLTPVTCPVTMSLTTSTPYNMNRVDNVTHGAGRHVKNRVLPELVMDIHVPRKFTFRGTLRAAFRT